MPSWPPRQRGLQPPPTSDFGDWNLLHPVISLAPSWRLSNSEIHCTSHFLIQPHSVMRNYPGYLSKKPTRNVEAQLLSIGMQGDRWLLFKSRRCWCHCIEGQHLEDWTSEGLTLQLKFVATLREGSSFLNSHNKGDNNLFATPPHDFEYNLSLYLEWQVAPGALLPCVFFVFLLAAHIQHWRSTSTTLTNTCPSWFPLISPNCFPTTVISFNSTTYLNFKQKNPQRSTHPSSYCFDEVGEVRELSIVHWNSARCPLARHLQLTLEPLHRDESADRFVALRRLSSTPRSNSSKLLAPH